MKPVLSAFICLSGKTLTIAEANLLSKYNPCGIVLFKRNIDNPHQVKLLTDDIKNATGNPDILIAIDQEGGAVRRLRPPYWSDYMSQQQIGSLPETEIIDAIKTHAILISNDLHNIGVNINFAPVADVLHTNTTCALKSRCFADSPKKVSMCSTILAQTYIQCGICPCMKHLPGHGLATQNSHLELPIIDSDIEIIKQDLLPFTNMASFIPMAMTAHIVLSAIDKLPITQSKKGIDFIRNEIGFNGLIITDALEMHALGGSLTDKVKKSIDAGCDIVCYCSGHNQNNSFIIEENTAVLEASQPLSDIQCEKLQNVLDIIHKNCVFDNLQEIRNKYEYFMKQTEHIQLSVNDYTENWSD